MAVRIPLPSDATAIDFPQKLRRATTAIRDSVRPGTGIIGHRDRRLLPHPAAELRRNTLDARRFKRLCRQQSRAPSVRAHGTQGTQLRSSDEPRGPLSHDGRVRGLPAGDQPREPFARACCPEVERGVVHDCQRRDRGADCQVPDAVRGRGRRRADERTRRGSPARQVPCR